MIDPLNIALAVIALFSALFVGITEGLKLTVGYRGSEETRQRKERIDEKLQRQGETEIVEFIDSKESKDAGSKRIEKMMDLGYRCYIAKNLTADILDSSDYHMKRAIRYFLVATCYLFVTIYIAIYLDILLLSNTIIFLAAMVLTAGVFCVVIISLSRSLHLRSALIELDENATLEYASDLHEELVDKDIL